MEDEDKDKDPTKPPTNLKAHSLSNNIRHATPNEPKRPTHHRKHSLDEARITNHQRHLGPPSYTPNTDGDTADFFPYTTTSSNAPPPNIRYDHSVSLPVITSSTATTPQEDDQNVSMQEFTASGGVGIFKAPSRSAVHPTRPPALELRPHPHRETQVGRFLRTIACTDTQLWAGQENGVRFWNFEDAYEAGVGYGGKGKRGDEDTAPFCDSGVTSPTVCMVVDHGNRLVWSGHKDGKIRSWKMDHNNVKSDEGEEASPFREGLCWQAHKGPVLALIISSYGDLWSGAEGGVIKIWPWDSIEKSLSLTAEEKHMAALLVERSGVDLRSQVTLNGVCNIPSSDIKAMLSDYARGRVWCATNLSFSLWDARTRELIKVFNIDGMIENRVEMPVQHDQPAEDEVKTKSNSHSKKDKQGFFARTRNTLMGAAEAVKRVATRGTGAFNEDNKKTEALALTSDGTIWSACSNGVILQWDSNGNRQNDFNHHNNSSALCFCTHGSRLWVGYANGMVQLLDLDGNLLAGWAAHSSPVIKMAIGGGHVFSIAIHGGIRGWHLTSPGQVDNIVRSALSSKELSYSYTRRENLKMLVGTWNVGQGKPNPEALRSWLGSVVTDVGIVVVGLQEVEMGAGFLAMSAAKETVGLEGSAIGQLWQDSIGKILDEGIVFERVGSRQLAGLLIAIWVRKNLRLHAGDLDVAAVACGFGRTIGNKGGVGLRLRVHDRIICFVNCHLAAHLEAVNRRNADFDHIFRSMVFSRQCHLLSVAAAGAASTSQGARNTSNGGGEKSDEGTRTDLSEADMVVFLGDFNYRLFGISYDEARDFVSQRSFDWLREKDQLRAEMKAGKVFQGMREAMIKFPPTYKFERHIPGLGGYDSGEKKRIPAWCDRVIYRDCRNGMVSECSLDCPILASVQMYEACMDVTESDHKPVRCKFSVHLARVDRSVRRKEFGAIMNTNEVKSLLKELYDIPETEVSTENITLQNQEASVLHITNKNKDIGAVFRIICQSQYTIDANGESTELRPRASFGFSSWLEVTPASGVLGTEQSMDVIVRHTESRTLGDIADGIPQNWWSEDNRDKEVVLAVQVGRSSSMELRTHYVRVRHCNSQTALRSDSKTNGSRRENIGSNNRSESPNCENNYDVVDVKGI